MLRRMRRSTVWFFIASLWFVAAIITGLHQGWQRAWLQAVIAIAFLAVGLRFHRKEQVR
ncbi:hypothetical protein H7849_18400 [Alloacidobacterium dinghuense]|uniref:Uncharacterized protein n=1 Tax=Alloacidobacterium dinghuense TaxID=2763107 RepID=A0A7G8BET8_9BACT|nr:hypothetical protein [Alloacidobacterium dinghuense]QNI31058.1 hypothetical protein H7849_18400 [Alloacidobacterium dinghuense]